MTDPVTVDLTGQHPCAVPGCRVSAEEHHRINVGLISENSELRRRLREQPPPSTTAPAAAATAPRPNPHPTTATRRR